MERGNNNNQHQTKNRKAMESVNKITLGSIGRVRKKRILLVEDEEDIAFIVKMGLEAKGPYDVDTYSDPIEAIDGFRAKAYDLVLIDIVMTDLSGFSLCSEIMEEAGNKNSGGSPRICFISAADYTEEEIISIIPELSKQKEEQGTIMVRKPIKIEDMVSLIEMMTR